MIKLIKKLIVNKKKRFERICDINNLKLNYQNKA